jgi:cation-transporting ATPase 13A3/4/5
MFSITTTVIETRSVRLYTVLDMIVADQPQTLRRLREISRFECDVRVLRNGFCKYHSAPRWDILSQVAGRSALSGDLVPGDVYEVSDPSLSQIPCDSLLLSGDCIINESMLTGLYLSPLLLRH